MVLLDTSCAVIKIFYFKLFENVFCFHINAISYFIWGSAITMFFIFLIYIAATSHNTTSTSTTYIQHAKKSRKLLKFRLIPFHCSTYRSYRNEERYTTWLDMGQRSLWQFIFIFLNCHFLRTIRFLWSLILPRCYGENSNRQFFNALFRFCYWKFIFVIVLNIRENYYCLL